MGTIAPISSRYGATGCVQTEDLDVFAKVLDYGISGPRTVPPPRDKPLHPERHPTGPIVALARKKTTQ